MLAIWTGTGPWTCMTCYWSFRAGGSAPSGTAVDVNADLVVDVLNLVVTLNEFGLCGAECLFLALGDGI